MGLLSFTFEREHTTRFIDLGYELYRGDPRWVPALRKDLEAQLSPAFPFYAQPGNDHRRFLALAGGRVVARAMATVNTAPTYDFRAGVLDGFNAAVSFTVTGLPGSLTPSFNPTTISPTPGTTRLTLNGALALASGEYTGTVTGTSGAQTRE